MVMHPNQLCVRISKHDINERDKGERLCSLRLIFAFFSRITLSYERTFSREFNVNVIVNLVGKREL